MILETAMASPFKPGYRQSQQLIIPEDAPAKFKDLYVILEKLCAMNSSSPSAITTRINSFHINNVLSGYELQQFLYGSTTLENLPHYRQTLGLLMSHLIKNSYDAGNSAFKFDMNGIKPLDYFCNYVDATREEKLEVVVRGALGRDAFSYTNGTFILEEAQQEFLRGGHFAELYLRRGIDYRNRFKKQSPEYGSAYINNVPDQNRMVRHEYWICESGEKYVAQFHFRANSFADGFILDKRKYYFANFHVVPTPTNGFVLTPEYVVSEPEYEWRKRWEPVEEKMAHMEKVLGASR